MKFPILLILFFSPLFLYADELTGQGSTDQKTYSPWGAFTPLFIPGSVILFDDSRPKSGEEIERTVWMKLPALGLQKLQYKSFHVLRDGGTVNVDLKFAKIRLPAPNLKKINLFWIGPVPIPLLRRKITPELVSRMGLGSRYSTADLQCQKVAKDLSD